MNLLHPRLETYLRELTPPRSKLLHELEALAEERHFPAVGPLVGRFLFQLVRLSNARKILELGSGFGYSAFWFAMALPEEGRIICTEYERANAESAIRFLEKAHLSHKVLFEVGDATEILHRYPGPFDLIFCDLDKQLYPRALELGLPRLKSGGLFVADNVLWSGRVADPADRSPETEGIRRFNRMIYEDPQLFTTILPLRDGVSISLKL